MKGYPPRMRGNNFICVLSGRGGCVCYPREIRVIRERGCVIRERVNPIYVIRERGRNRNMLSKRDVIRERGYLPRASRPLRRLFAPRPVLQPLPRFLKNINPAPTFVRYYLYPSFFLVFVILTICVHGRR